MAALVVLFAAPARADVTVAVSPSLLEFGVDAGAEFAQEISVSNIGEDPAAISVSVSPKGNGGAESNTADWFSTSPADLRLAPGETKIVTVYVRVPKDAAPGGRYATVFFGTGVASAERSVGRFVGGKGVGASIGSAFLLTVQGPDLKLKGQVDKVVPVSVGPGRLGARVELTNSGNVHLFPSGEVELKDSEGAVVGIFALPETTALLPGETRSFYLEGTHDVADGDYRAQGKFDFGWDAQQTSAVQVDAEEWNPQEDVKDIEFNSVPKLRVVEVLMHGSDDSGVQVELELENYGDVEVAPAGYLDVLSDQGERLALLNIGAGSFVVEPHTRALKRYTHREPISRGEYQIAAQLNYHGRETAVGSATAVIERDILPPIAPEAPAAQRAVYQPATPVWVWGALGGAGLLAMLTLGATFVTLCRRSPAA